MSDEAKEPIIPAGLQPGPTPQPSIPEASIDEMGVANPTFDISPRIEYLFYKCQRCGKKEFAGGMDKHLEADCVCVITPATKTTKATHGKMILMKYSAPRPGVRQPEEFTKPVGA